MKLKLEALGDISILNVEGPLGPEDMQVLRTGLIKLFRAGKNRIALRFSQVKDMSGEQIREVAIANLYARELAGEIAFVCADKALLEKVKHFSKPAPFSSFEEMAACAEFLKNPHEQQGSKREQEIQKTLLDRDEEIKKLKTELAEKSGGELAQIKQENSKLKSTMKILQENLDKMIIERRQPPDEAAFIEKIRGLEDRVGQMNDELAAAREGAQKK